jgi:hypothetical protein
MNGDLEAYELIASRSPPLNPDDLLTPPLSSFGGGEGDGSRWLAFVQRFNARN